MVISNEVNSENCNDFALFDTATEILRAMSDHGNLAATEFYDNLEEVRGCLNKTPGSNTRGSFPNSSHLPHSHTSRGPSLLGDVAAQDQVKWDCQPTLIYPEPLHRKNLRMEWCSWAKA